MSGSDEVIIARNGYELGKPEICQPRLIRLGGKPETRVFLKTEPSALQFNILAGRA